jgi:hypothetical protein
MRTRNLSFQLEKTLPGVFLIQGWFGGAVAGLVYAAALCFWHHPFNFTRAVSMSGYFVIFGSFLGVFKSTILWVPYRLTRIQVRPATRVVISSIGTGVFALLLALKFGYGFERPNDTAAWVLSLVLGGLPTAILVGSSVKPWQLFTFGSIAVGDSQTGRRVGSKNVLATLATLPLRFLSLVGLALLILACACRFDPAQGVIGPAIVFIYLLYSAYLTFKSPHRVLLLVSCIALNLPVGLITCYAYIIDPGSYLYTEALPYVCGIGSAFLLAWAIFLIGRLTVPTQRMISETDLQEVLKSSGSHLDHNCLGSRFIEWQERHA